MWPWNPFKRDPVRLGQEDARQNMDSVDELLRDYQRSCNPEQMGKMLEKIQNQNSVQHKLIQKLLFERNHLLKINKELATKNSELEKVVEKQRAEISHIKMENGFSQASHGGYVNTYHGGDEASGYTLTRPLIGWSSHLESTRMPSQRSIDLKRKKLRQVFVYLYSAQRDQIPPATDITSRINEVLVQRDIELTCEVIETTPIPEHARPVILMCVNVSRLGTDVSNALKDITASEDVAVVVLHHKDVHVLPKLSSEKSLTGPEFQELGAIVDMAFWKEKGLHHCDINQTAIMKLADFLTDYAVP